MGKLAHRRFEVAAHNPAVAVQLNALTRVVVAIDPGDTPESFTRLSKLYSAAIDALEAGDSATAIDVLGRAATTRLRALSRLGDGVLDRWLTWPEIDRALEQSRKPL